ncbi:MAG: hypothetical protein H6742_04320 [Alphaproteobacteria bacterium]|nr:hypothetical protein [Alphaproteobacteria bacterium]
MRRAVPLTVLLVSALIGGAACDPDGNLTRRDDRTAPVEVEETFTQAPLPKVDVLWVVDTTPSMESELAALADAFDSFSASLDGLDLSWQAGVVTTDPDDAVLRGNPWIIHPDLDDPSGAFAAAIDLPLDATAPEAGLAAAAVALIDAGQDNVGFRRPDAALQVIVVSDADDESEGWMGSDPGSTFLEFLAGEEEATGLPATLSAVVGPPPSGCVGAAPAERYATVAEESGGVVASICDPDLATIVAEIGEASIAWPDTFPLQEAAEPGSVVVRIDGDRTDAWTLADDALSVTMDAPPPPGSTVRIRYRVAEDT